MSTENATARRFGGLGVRWYHIVLALAFGVGGGILPPDGAVTFAGWVGGFLGSLTTAVVVSGLVLFATRTVDDWRPTDLAGVEVPDSRFRYLILAAIAAQLFVLGSALAADVTLATLVTLVSAVNPLVALFVLGDMLRLRDRGIEWEQAEFGFPVAALLVGVVGGLAYWFRRGRKRTAVAGTEPSTGAEPPATEDEQAETAADAEGGQAEPPADAEGDQAEPAADAESGQAEPAADAEGEQPEPAADAESGQSGTDEESPASSGAAESSETDES